jgi:hypothetical protein
MSDGSGGFIPDPARINNAKMQEYRQSFFSTSYGFTSSIRPLYQNQIFGASNIQYNLKGLTVRSEFIGTGDEPEWELIWGEWEKEKVSIHNFSTNFSALFMDKTQTFSMTAELPPRDSALSWRTGLRVWITETDASWRIQHPGDPEERKLDPFIATERINFAPYGNFTQNLNLDTELREMTSMTSTLNLTKWSTSVSYTAARMLGFEPNASGTDWVQRTGDENMTLRNRDFIINFSRNFKAVDFWNDRIRFNVNTSSRMFFDLQRYTSSNLTFSMGFTLGITRFLNLSMSANSDNSVIYRYFRNWFFFNREYTDMLNIPDGPQNNLFRDLIDSFRFDDDDLRKRSGFKMKNFRISAIHYLGDWNATLNWTMMPFRPVGRREYDMNNEVSFLLEWVPITEIKSDISFNKQRTPEWVVQGL